MRRTILLAFMLFCCCNQFIYAQAGGKNINGWYNTDEFVSNNAILGSDFLKLDFLFPDSSIKYKGDDGEIKTFETYSVGHIFDLQHYNWAAVPSNPIYPIQIFDASKCDFYLDSIRFKYFYKRNVVNTNTVDTVFIYYYNNFDEQQIVKWQNTVGFNDTMAAATPYPFSNAGKHGRRYFKKDTVLLTEKDTSNVGGYSFITKNIGKHFEAYNEPYPAKRALFGFSFIYKPGFSYKLNDTLITEKDDSVKTKLNLFGVYHTRLKLPVTLKSRMFAENSLFLSYKNAYGSNYNGIKGFVPGTALKTVKYLHCGAFIQASACTLSVKSFKKPINAYIKSVSPNPIQNGNSLNVLLKNKQAANYAVEIVDIVGNRIDSKTIFCDNDSETTAVWDFIPQLKEGVYFILLKEIDTYNVIDTKKLIKIF